MFQKIFKSLYGFSLAYPEPWTPTFSPERIIFTPADEISEPYTFTLSMVQTSIPDLNNLSGQIRSKLQQTKVTTLVSEGNIYLGGITGYNCLTRYVSPSSNSNTPASSISKQTKIVALPLLAGKLTLLMMFTSELEVYLEFEHNYVTPILNSFQLDEKICPPKAGYRRLAQDEYGIAIDFPENWLITELKPRRLAFRASEQRWQIDNVTLLTAIGDNNQSLSDHYRLAIDQFQSTPGVEVIKTYGTTLADLPAYSIEYTLLDRLQVLNQGQQVVALSNNRVLISLTTLAPQQSIEDYRSIFETVYQTLIIQPV